MKKLLVLVFAIALCLGVLCLGASADGITPSKPAQDTDGVYQIGTVAELYWFAGLVNGTLTDGTAQNTAAHAKLTNNITINTGVLAAIANGSTPTYTWTPICTDYNKAYTGTFDGDGHTISGLYYSGSGDDYICAGLFGYVGSGGRVQNVNVADSYINVNVGDMVNVYVGGVCGYNYGTITNCSFAGSVTGTDTGSGIFTCVGGVSGYNNSGTITNCRNTGSVTSSVNGMNYVGGVSGNNNRGTITNCYWQSGTADEADASATEKTETQFASGEVAWLLNKGQTNGPWRQNLSGDADTSPVLDSTHEEVVKLTVDGTASYHNEGYAFSGETDKAYFKDGAEIELPYTVKEDTELTSAALYTVTVVYDNGTEDEIKSVASGDTFKLPDAPSRSGYTFVGWSDGNKTYEAGDSVTITADTTFTAVWKQLFTVTVVYDNGTADTKEQVVDGDSFKLPDAPSKSGYYFVGWSDGNTTYKAGAMVENITADTTFTAVWREINIPDPNGITVTQPANGTIRVNPSNGSAGTPITVTATPDEGYELAYITVDGERITGNTFRMPDKSVTVSAVFVPATFPFVDVKSGDWFYDYVAYVYSNGLMDGTSATTFEPNANMTRAMVWAILARIDGETVTGAAWATDARAWAMAEGVSDGTDPNGLVTREQFATMLYRYAVAKGYDVSIGESTNILSYADFASISEYAIPAMQWACGSGIVTGVTDTTLVPQGTATRAQCAAMLMRFVEL